MGYPILVKAVMGGGGKGMKLVTCEKQLKVGCAWTHYLSE